MTANAVDARSASAIEQSLITDIPKLNADEQESVRFFIDRILVQGRASYAPWVASLDARDIDMEIAEELADAVIYTAMRAVKRAQAKRRRVEAFRHDEAYRAVDEAMRPLIDEVE